MQKLLPPILFVILILLMGVATAILAPRQFIPYPYNIAGTALLLPGLAISLYHSRLFRRLGTNVMTFGEPDQFVTTGLFRFTRNPMYLGMVIALLGMAVLLQGAIFSFVLVVLFAVITDRWYIRFEETAMAAKFGERYAAYCRQTPRWIWY